MLHDLIVKVCYKKSLFYIITIWEFEIYDQEITFELIHYVVGKKILYR
jgi:hypothetical protein